MEFQQNRFDIAAINEMHVACVLLLDTSSSMEGEPINKLNEALCKFKEQTMLDEIGKKRIDIAIVEFNSRAQVVQPFYPLSRMEPPTLRATGMTALGEGLSLSLDLIEQRKAHYKEVGTPYYRPWIFMITDGQPTDEYEEAALRAKQMAKNKKVIVWAVGVPGYSVDSLREITDRIFEMEDVNFPAMFEWVSNSLVRTSISNGGKITYPDLPEKSRQVTFVD